MLFPSSELFLVLLLLTLQISINAFLLIIKEKPRIQYDPVYSFISFGFSHLPARLEPSLIALL